MERKEEKSHRNYKDSVFRKLFSEKENAIELYNAVAGTNYGPDTPIRFLTLENILVDGPINDLEFEIDGRRVAFAEAQSTICENIPYRLLGYTSRSLDQILAEADIYARKAVQIPPMEYYVFYSGHTPWNKKYLRLSENYMETPSINSMELVAKVISLWYDEDREMNEVLRRSPTLRGYQTLVQYVEKEIAKTRNLDLAIAHAVDRCIREGYLRDFLTKYKTEVEKMILGGRTQEDWIRVVKKNERAEGKREGRADMLRDIKSMVDKGVSLEEAVQALSKEQEKL